MRRILSRPVKQLAARKHGDTGSTNNVRMGTSSTTKRGILGATVALTIAGIAALMPAAPAAAAGDPLVTSYTHSNVSGGAWLRSQPNTGSYGIEYLYNNTEVVMICWTDAQSVSPPNSNYTSNRWFMVEPTYDVNIGYVHSSFVYHQISVRHC